MQTISSILNTNTINTPKKSKLNINIGIEKKNGRDIDPRKVEFKARELLKKLDSNEKSLEFFCSAFYKLPDQTVYRLAGLASDPGVRNKGAYFNTLIRREINS